MTTKTTDDQLLATLTRLADADETIAAGGVAPSRLADDLPITTKTVRKRLADLHDAGRVERDWGFQDGRPTPGYRPAKAERDQRVLADGGTGNYSSGMEQTAGTILVKGETPYQLVDDQHFGVVATEIGNRELSEEQVPEIGDDCIIPDCDGHVKDVNGKRWCSEGCLGWMRTTPKDGDECDKYGNRCDGTLHEVGDLEWECDSCSRFRSSAYINWREYWLPGADRTLQPESDHAGGDSR